MSPRSLVLFVGCVCVNAQLVIEPWIDPEEIDSLDGGAPSAPLVTTGDAPKIVNPKLCDPSVAQHAGFLPVGDKRELYFWMMESRSAPSTDPLILWLTGGPGCSSMLALLAENGPCSVEKGGATTKLNPYSWNAQANVIWLDQPAGAGFSKGSPQGNEDFVAEDVYNFLQKFFETLPQYSKLDFFIFGESYAGHYIPAVSHRIWKGNKAGEAAPIKLTGIAIGNGLTNPEEQYKWYAEMAHTGAKAYGGTAPPVITSNFTYGIMKAAITPCVNAIHKCNAGHSLSCETAFIVCNYGEQVPYRLSGMNPYDMRIKCEHGNLCYDFSDATTWLNNADVQKELGVSQKWESCNMLINLKFQGDFMKNYHTLLPDMLADGIRVMLYAGDCDFICNWLGNKQWALALDWPHKDEFNKAEDQDVKVGDKTVGRKRESNGFSFFQVYQAGHMVPMDQPEVALQMVKEFTSSGASLVV